MIQSGGRPPGSRPAVRGRAERSGEAMTPDQLLSPDHTILDRPFMQFAPFGTDERGERIRDVSGMIVRDNVEYLEEWITRMKGGDAGRAAVAELCRLLNERIRDTAHHVTTEQLRNVWNSYSYEFVSYLREFCRQLSGDRNFHANVGRDKHISPLIQTLGRPFSLAQVHRMYPYFAQKFAKGLEYTVVDVTDCSAVLRLKLTERIYEQFGLYRKACAAQICDSSKGRIAMVPPKLHFLPASQVTDRACIVRGDEYCEWEVRWQPSRQREAAWFRWGAAASVAAVALARTVSPDLGLAELALAGVIPLMGAGLLMNHRLRRQSRQRESLIREQISFVESRHEELREAYLEQEQTRVELRHKISQLTALHRAGLLFSSTLDRETLLQQVLETLTRDLRYDRAMISFYDPALKVMGDSRVRGVTPEVRAFIQSRMVPVDDPNSPEGLVVLQGRPLLVTDVRSLLDRLHPLNRKLVEMTGAQSLIVVPLRAKDRVLGTLTVDRKQAGSLTQDDLELVTTVASQAAIALDNAAAYRQIEEWNMGLEMKVRERTAALEHADQMRAQFLSHVSHELKTPLTSIKGYIQNLLDGLTGPLNDKQHRYLSRLLENSDRLIRMIEDLLDRTRIEAGRLELLPTEVDLEPCLSETVEQLRPLAQAKQQELLLRCPAETLIAWADRDRLIQIVVNLVQNAIKFTPVDGMVVVTVEPSGDRMAGIVIRDTGPGIPPEFLDQIFDPFFRVKQGHRSGPKGLGLGLSIVKTLVELQGGTVTAGNHPDGGAQFHFTVPLLQSVGSRPLTHSAQR